MGRTTCPEFPERLVAVGMLVTWGVRSSTRRNREVDQWTSQLAPHLWKLKMLAREKFYSRFNIHWNSISGVVSCVWLSVPWKEETSMSEPALCLLPLHGAISRSQGALCQWIILTFKGQGILGNVVSRSTWSLEWLYGSFCAAASWIINSTFFHSQKYPGLIINYVVPFLTQPLLLDHSLHLACFRTLLVLPTWLPEVPSQLRFSSP